jgi:hypothetical protein
MFGNPVATKTVLLDSYRQFPRFIYRSSQVLAFANQTRSNTDKAVIVTPE